MGPKSLTNNANIVDEHKHLGLLKKWVVVVEWSEPEGGLSVEGPFDTHHDARSACTADDAFLVQFAVYDEDTSTFEVTDDVTFTILALS